MKEADLKRCPGDGCFAKDWCKRTQSKSEDAFEKSPIDSHGGGCDYFIPISDTYVGAVPPATLPGSAKAS